MKVYLIMSEMLGGSNIEKIYLSKSLAEKAVCDYNNKELDTARQMNMPDFYRFVSKFQVVEREIDIN